MTDIKVCMAFAGLEGECQRIRATTLFSQLIPSAAHPSVSLEEAFRLYAVTVCGFAL